MVVMRQSFEWKNTLNNTSSLVSFFLEAITHDKCTKVIDAAINHSIYEAIEMLILSSLRKKLCFG